MADTRGCWSLSEAWEEKGNAEWVPIPNVWLTPKVTKVNHGYIGGGDPSANVDKLNFANDTKSSLGNIWPGSPRKSGGVGGNTHGYVGGKHPGYENFINKMVFATDAGSRIPATLPVGRGYLAGCNSETNGYFVGGAGSFNSYRSIVDKITHATDTCARIPSADLPSANTKQSNMATTASPSAAYCGGGVSPATTAVSKLTFSTEQSAQVPGAAMITARGYASCSSNGTNTYWYGGSSNNNGTSPTSDIDKTVFASDTTSNIPANMPNAYNTRKSATGSDTFGVIAGGTPGNPSNFGGAYKFTYSNESVASAPGMNLTNDKREASGLSARNGFTGATYDGDTIRWFDSREEGDYAVLFDGNDYLSITGWDGNSRFGAGAMTWECWVKFTGSDGTLETLWENRSSTGANDGFLIGRFHTSGHENKIEMFTASDYRITTDVTVANDVWTHVAYSKDGNNAEARIYINGTEAGSFTDGYNYDHTGTAYIGRNASNSHKMYGYISNMRVVTGKSLYTSNFTVPTEPLTSTSQGATAATTQFIICNTSDIEESTVLASGLSISESGFSSNDSASGQAVFPSNIPPAATPTSNTSLSYGPAFNGAIWMGGYNNDGGPTFSSGGKITFSDDTVTALPSTQLTGNRYNLAATSSSTAGYYGQAQTLTVVKVDYATSTPSNAGNLSGGPANSGNDARRRGASFGLKTAGYFTNGSTGSSGNLSNLDKITYSSGVIARLPGSNSPNGAYATSGTSNQTAGYKTGGTPGGAPLYKFPFSTESWGSIPSLGVTMWDAKTFANATHGFWMGGDGNTDGSMTYKLTFASDTSSRLPSSNTPHRIRYGWGSGNSTHGYISGGNSNSNRTSNIYKMSYSNDTWSGALPNTLQPNSRQNAAAGARQNGNGDTAGNTVPNVI